MISETLKIILSIVVTLAGFPLGILIKKLTKDEQKTGRKYFKLLVLACVVGIILTLFFVRDNLLFAIEILVFIFLVALASLVKIRK